MPQEPLVAAKYGFLYSSYSRRLPYWETTEMIRKFLVALLPVSQGALCVFLDRLTRGLGWREGGPGRARSCSCGMARPCVHPSATQAGTP